MLYAALVILALAVLGLAFVYASWEQWDDYRRLERLTHRNLDRMCGR